MERKPYISPSFSYVPLEETLEIMIRKRKLFIGIPKETSFQENRVELTPDAVSVLITGGTIKGLHKLQSMGEIPVLDLGVLRRLPHSKVPSTSGFFSNARNIRTVMGLSLWLLKPSSASSRQIWASGLPSAKSAKTL